MPRPMWAFAFLYAGVSMVTSAALGLTYGTAVQLVFTFVAVVTAFVITVYAASR